MKLFDLISEADPLRDYKFRSEAQRVFNKIFPYFKNHILKNINFDGYRATMDMKSMKNELPEYEELIIQAGSVSGAYFSASEKSRPLIYLNVWNAKEKDFINIKTIKTYFIHEFVHYQDWKRRQKPEHFGPSGKYVKDNEYEKYFNDPGEFNSFFQQFGLFTPPFILF
mgnify:CR=1 FL=1